MPGEDGACISEETKHTPQHTLSCDFNSSLLAATKRNVSSGEERGLYLQAISNKSLFRVKVIISTQISRQNDGFKT